MKKNSTPKPIKNDEKIKPSKDFVRQHGKEINDIVKDVASRIITSQPIKDGKPSR